MANALYGGTVIADAKAEYKRNPVPLKAALNAKVGEILVTVAGYGVYPAAANNATGRCMGVVVVPADNTSGADGAVSAMCEERTVFCKNDGTHPCVAATVGEKVYASDKETVSITSTDGALVGVLVLFNDARALPGRPCEVRLERSA